MLKTCVGITSVGVSIILHGPDKMLQMPAVDRMNEKCHFSIINL